MFGLELREEQERGRTEYRGNTHSKGLGGRKGAGKRAARDCLEKELVCITRVGVTIIRIRFGCNQITEI